MWIGASRNEGNKKFQDIAIGNKINQRLWGQDQPSTSSEHFDCVAMNPSLEFKLSNHRCDSYFSFICQLP